jgi:hypothetical protein
MPRLPRRSAGNIGWEFKMGSQRARAACDGGSIYDDRSAFQDVERTARYEGTRLSGKMPSARRLRRKAVRCEYARARAACETGLRVRCGELVPRRPRRPEPDYAGPARRRVNEAGFKTTRLKYRSCNTCTLSVHTLRAVRFPARHTRSRVQGQGYTGYSGRPLVPSGDEAQRPPQAAKRSSSGERDASDGRKHGQVVIHVWERTRRIRG